MAKSDTILGRKLNREEFRKGRRFRVSVYRDWRGTTRYTDPVSCRPSWTVRYRIIVTPNHFGRT